MSKMIITLSGKYEEVKKKNEKEKQYMQQNNELVL